MAEVRGHVAKDDRVLIVRAIDVHYRLSGVADDQKDAVERVMGFHADKCPVARSISGCVDITTTLEYV